MENIDKIIQEKIKKDLENRFNEGFTVLRETIKDFLSMGENQKEMAKLLKEVLEKYIDKENRRDLSNILIDSKSDFLQTSKYIDTKLDYFIKKHLDELDRKEKLETKYEKLYNEKKEELRSYREEVYNEKYNKKEEVEDQPGEEKEECDCPGCQFRRKHETEIDAIMEKEAKKIAKAVENGELENFLFWVDPAKPGAETTGIYASFIEKWAKKNKHKVKVFPGGQAGGKNFFKDLFDKIKNNG